MIRVSVKALIIREDHLLVLENKAGNLFYTPPGGGQNPGETMVQAIQRECLEEISVRVKVGEIAFVRDYIGANHEFAAKHKDLHQIEIIFRCSILENAAPAIGRTPDADQVGFKWLPLTELEESPFYPKELRPHLKRSTAIYLGDIN